MSAAEVEEEDPWDPLGTNQQALQAEDEISAVEDAEEYEEELLQQQRGLDQISGAAFEEEIQQLATSAITEDATGDERGGNEGAPPRPMSRASQMPPPFVFP